MCLGRVRGVERRRFEDLLGYIDNGDTTQYVVLHRLVSTAGQRVSRCRTQLV